MSFTDADIPDLSEISILDVITKPGMNNPDVLQFPITVIVDFTARHLPDGNFEITWTPPFVDKPVSHVIDDEPHIGAAGWAGYDLNSQRWVGGQGDHLRANDREDHTTFWPLEERFEEYGVRIDFQRPFLVWCAGMWRYAGAANPARRLPEEFEWRTNVQAFDLRDLPGWSESPPDEPSADYLALRDGILALADELERENEEREKSKKNRKRRVAREITPIIARIRARASNEES